MSLRQGEEAHMSLNHRIQNLKPVLWQLLRIRHMHALTFGVKLRPLHHKTVFREQKSTQAHLPAVEGAADIPANYSAAHRQIGAKMRAKSVKQRWLTLLSAKQDQLATESPYGHHL